MKKFVNAALAAMPAAAMLLAACGTSLSGTYKADGGLAGLMGGTYTFSSGGSVEITYGGGILATTTGGTYRIKGGEIFLTTTVPGVPVTEQYSFSKKGNQLIVDGKTYTKQ